MLDHARLAGSILPFVLSAGAAELKYYRSDVAVERKRDESPVTAADREAEEILLAGLAQIAPEIPVIAEESVAAGQVPDFNDRFFLVDPLDGTREFIERREEFTVNVALVEGGVPVFGLVYAPALGDLYATHGRSLAVHARLAAQPAIPPNLPPAFQPIMARLPDEAALVAVASRSHGTPETEDYLSQFHIVARRNAGSSLKFCLIARGEADIYPRLGPTMAWDTAAGHAVLLAAGGHVETLDGKPLTYGLRTEGTFTDRLRNPYFVAWGRRPLAARG